MDCEFCKIIDRKLPAEIMYENDRVIVFKDYKPKARIHLLVCPRAHYDTFMDAPAEEVAYLFKICRRLAEKLQVENGFRMVINNGSQGGQIIYHLHIHFLSWMKDLDNDRIDL